MWLPDRHRHVHTHGQTDARQSDPYVPLCFTGDTKSKSTMMKADLDQKLIIWKLATIFQPDIWKHRGLYVWKFSMTDWLTDEQTECKHIVPYVITGKGQIMILNFMLLGDMVPWKIWQSTTKELCITLIKQVFRSTTELINSATVLFKNIIRNNKK